MGPTHDPPTGTALHDQIELIGVFEAGEDFDDVP
jgi:hypothetical protein